MKDSKKVVGSRWWKTDFHLHSPGSYDYQKEDIFGNPVSEITPEDFLKACMEKELDCIMITDHNDFSWIDTVRDCLKNLRESPPEWFREITIFPGIEITAVGNIHILGFFDPSISIEKLYEIKGKLKFTNDSRKEDITANLPVTEIISEIYNSDGIAVPAHVDKACGLFNSEASFIRTTLDSDLLLALEVTENEVNNETYKSSKLNLSYILGSDSHSLAKIGSMYSWVKMGTPSIEALRLAFLDDEDGVKRSIEHPNIPSNFTQRFYIDSITISKGKLIGRKEPLIVNFSPMLNSIIGGRGTGKSTILQFLRLIYKKQNELPTSLQNEFNRFACLPKDRNSSGMLVGKDKNHIETKVFLELVDNGVHHSFKWENFQTFELHNGDWIPINNLQERFPISIYNQKQLFELSENPHLLLNYIDKEWDKKSWENDLEKLKGEYTKKSLKKSELENQLKTKETVQAQINDINQKISIFETKETQQLFKDKEKIEEEEKTVTSLYDRFKPIIDNLRNFSEVQTPILNLDLSSLDLETREIVNKWILILENTIENIQSIIKSNPECLYQKEEFLSNLPLFEKKELLKNQLDNKMNELSAQGVSDIDKYSELLEERESLIQKLKPIVNTEEDLRKVEDQIKNLDVALVKLIEEREDAREEVITKWNDLGRLKISLNYFGDYSINEPIIRGILRKEKEFSPDILDQTDEGDYIGFLSRFSNSNSTSLTESLSQLNLIKKALLRETDEITFGRRFQNYLDRSLNEISNMRNEISLWIPEDQVNLSLNVASPGKRERTINIESGSPGQRTSAILQLLLQISQNPLILDQPEDDLDTKHISNLVVEGIKDLKQYSQLIIATHNSNIVVNGNSEYIIHLDVKNGQIGIECADAMQNQTIRNSICEVMEGGREALEKRYKRIFEAGKHFRTA